MEIHRIHPGGYIHIWVFISSWSSVQKSTTLVSVLGVVTLFFCTSSGNHNYNSSSLRQAEWDALLSWRSWPLPLHSFSLNPCWVISTVSKVLKVLPHEMFIKIKQKCVLKSSQKCLGKRCRQKLKCYFPFWVIPWEKKKKKRHRSGTGRLHFWQKCIESKLPEVHNPILQAPKLTSIFLRDTTSRL